MAVLDLRSICVTNGVGIFILLMLLYVSKARNIQGRSEDKIFTFLIFGVMAGCFLETFSYLIDGRVFAGSVPLNYAANTFLYSFNLLLPLFVLIYVDLGLYEDPGRIWKKYKPQIIIGIIMISLNIVNYYIPVIYDISAANVYSRKPLSYVFYLVILYYLLTALFVTRKYEKENGTMSFFNIKMFLLPIIIGAGLQFMFYGLSVAWLASAIGLIGLYMMQQNEMAYIDSLTDTYNRQYMNNILSSWVNRGYHFSGTMLDIDNFKAINDNYGHAEGDKVLKALTDIMKESRCGKEWIFRLAGDEFVVLKISETEDQMADFIDGVSRRADEYNSGGRPYDLVVSYGTSFFSGGDIEVFMKEMDNRMYAMKAEHHSLLFSEASCKYGMELI